MRPRRGNPDRLAPLDEALQEIEGRRLSGAERDAFGRYLDLLMLWNRTHDLTACRTEADMVTGLFRDSLLFLRVLGDIGTRGSMRVVDIGPGAGVPGLPVCLVRPSLRLTMIEARRKRVSFLRAVQRALSLPHVDILEGRAEAVVEQHIELLGEYAIVLGRGVAAHDLLVWALPFLGPGGLVVSGGPPRPAEVPRLAGYSGVEWRKERFPGIGVERTFLVAHKTGGDPGSVPRGTG